MAEAEATDAGVDQSHGRGRRGDELPDGLQRRTDRLAKIQTAKALLEERARAEAGEAAARREAEGKQPPAEPPAEAVPQPKALINFTDARSRIMKTSDEGWDPCVNAQAVANEGQIILAADVTEQTNDKRQAVPMMDQTLENHKAAGVKRAIGVGVMDSGYHSESNAKALEERGIDPHIATERLKHNQEIPPLPRGRIPKDYTAQQRMARELRTANGRATYVKRKGIIEPIFGQLKQVLGFRQFSSRGLALMRGKWRLMCAVHNLLKPWRHGRVNEAV